MGVPDGLAYTSRSEIDLLLTWFFYCEIVAAYRERVTASAFGRDSQYDFIVTEILRCHFEIEHAVRTQIDIIESAWEDGNARVRRTLPHFVVTFRQMDIEFAITRIRRRDCHLTILFVKLHRLAARGIGRSSAPWPAR